METRAASGAAFRGAKCAVALATAAGALSLFAQPGHAADVYVSLGADGSPRYASQALDPSYSLVIADPASPQVQAQAPATRPRTQGSRLQLRHLVEKIARQHGIDPGLVESVIEIESGFDTKAVSARGARGAMQLMPATGRRYGLVHPHEFDLAERNIEAGVRHLKDLIVQHQGNLVLALAAYNAGAGAVATHGHRIPPYRETMLYVPAVLSRTAGEPRVR